jgi:hypothetical protein
MRARSAWLMARRSFASAAVFVAVAGQDSARARSEELEQRFALPTSQDSQGIGTRVVSLMASLEDKLTGAAKPQATARYVGSCRFMVRAVRLGSSRASRSQRSSPRSRSWKWLSCRCRNRVGRIGVPWRSSKCKGFVERLTTRPIGRRASSGTCEAGQVADHLPRKNSLARAASYPSRPGPVTMRSRARACTPHRRGRPMAAQDDGSISRWIGDLKGGGDSAAQHLWER